MNNYTYTIIDIADLDSVDFSEVHETSAATIRKSINGTKFVMEYLDEPTFVTDGTVTPSAVMNHEDALTLMATPEWTNPDPPM